jgi:hypothetical protein
MPIQLVLPRAGRPGHYAGELSHAVPIETALVGHAFPSKLCVERRVVQGSGCCRDYQSGRNIHAQQGAWPRLTGERGASQ